jgi:twitching motility two-component system response regulator PilG
MPGALADMEFPTKKNGSRPAGCDGRHGIESSQWQGGDQYVKTPTRTLLRRLASQSAQNANTHRGFDGMDNTAASNSRPRLAGLKVLVIDDSKTIRRTAETLLAREGCEVFTAVDGFDALSKIADHQPDIVFVDIMMPRLDGYQTCSLIKHNKVFKSIPVIMLSSKDGLFDRARGRIVGSEHYLTKPFTREELLSAIESHVPRA